MSDAVGDRGEIDKTGKGADWPATLAVGDEPASGPRSPQLRVGNLTIGALILALSDELAAMIGASLGARRQRGAQATRTES